MSPILEKPTADEQIPFELESMGFAKNYRQALLEAFRPYLGSKVLEVGGGLGHFSELLSRDPGVALFSIIEPDASFREVLQQKKIPAELLPEPFSICQAMIGSTL